MHIMSLLNNGMIAGLVLATLSGAALAEDRMPETIETRKAAVSKALADSATRAAIGETIEALAQANRLDLEIRFADRTKESTVDGP